MIKRIENWLRLIFADEAGKVEATFKEELQRIETSFAEDRERFLAEIRDSITADLKQFRADCVAEKLLIAVPQSWQADEETRKADHHLRHPRPLRR